MQRTWGRRRQRVQDSHHRDILSISSQTNLLHGKGVRHQNRNKKKVADRKEKLLSKYWKAEKVTLSTNRRLARLRRGHRPERGEGEAHMKGNHPKREPSPKKGLGRPCSIQSEAVFTRSIQDLTQVLGRPPEDMVGRPASWTDLIKVFGRSPEDIVGRPAFWTRGYHRPGQRRGSRCHSRTVGTTA